MSVYSRRAPRVASCVAMLAVTHFAGVARGEPPTPATIRAAAQKSLSLLEASADEYTRQRDCFSCHHQALPAMTLALAARREFNVSAQMAQRQAEFTVAFFQGLGDGLPRGESVPGGSYTSGYALAGLESAGWPADQTVDQLLRHLLARQRDDGRWTIESRRPPLEFSDITATALGLRAIARWTSAPAAHESSDRVQRAGRWLAAASADGSEELAYKLLGLSWSDAPAADVEAARIAVLEIQQPDGGWSQIPGRATDAYATGQCLVALAEAGQATSEEVYQRGVAYLLACQKSDGSWHIVSRSHPFQTYFESGYPHDVDQFISISAASWATMALIHGLP